MVHSLFGMLSHATTVFLPHVLRFTFNAPSLERHSLPKVELPISPVNVSSLHLSLYICVFVCSHSYPLPLPITIQSYNSKLPEGKAMSTFPQLFTQHLAQRWGTVGT